MVSKVAQQLEFKPFYLLHEARAFMWVMRVLFPYAMLASSKLWVVLMCGIR